MSSEQIDRNKSLVGNGATHKVAAAFEAAMSKAISTYKDAPPTVHFKTLTTVNTPYFAEGAGQPDKDKDTKIAEVKASGDQEAIKRLDSPDLADIGNTGIPLANIESIHKVSDNVIELKTRDGQNITIIKQITPYLFDAMASKADAVGVLNDSKSEGFRIAQSGDTRPGLGDYKGIGPADELGPGFIRYETLSGDKVIVSKEVNMNLYEQVKADRATWQVINTSKDDGYRLAGNDETANLKFVGTPEELGHGLIRYESATGEKIIVSQDISPNLYDYVVKESHGVHGVDGAPDTSWIDNSKYGAGASDWDKIVGNTSGKPTQEEKDLDRPRATSKMLEDNWDNWGLHDRKVDFANPPSDLPPDAQACLKYLAGSPSAMAALDCGGLGKTDGVITRNDVKSFISQSNKDLSAATKSYDKFLSKNPNATDLAKQNAKSAALVMANISLVSSAGPQMQGDNRRASVGDLNVSNLQAIKDDAGLSKSLTGAAGYWSSPGMLRTLDMGGMLPATAKADGIAQQKNIAAWLENQAPSDDHGVLMLLSNASIRNSVADVDPSTLSKDVLEHPEKYDGKTKAAVLLEITDARTRLAMSDKVGDGDLYAGLEADVNYHLNPTKAKLTAQLDAAIGQLSSDTDVKTFLSVNQGAGIAAIINSDPAMKVELQHYQDKQINSGNIINTSLAHKGADGQPLAMADALGLAATDATLTDLALGGDGKIDLAAMADKSGKAPEIEQYFREHILNGKDLQDGLAKENADPLAVVQKFATDAAILTEFLGNRITAQDTSAVQQWVTETLSETLVDGANDDVLKNAFGDENGNFDEAKTKDIIDKAMAADPEMFKDSTGAQITGEDVVTLIRSLWDVNRQGEKISDALPKAIEKFKLEAGPAYKQGLLHVGSALLAGGVLAARSATGGNSTADNALRVSAGMQFAGLMMEGGTKYAKEAGYGRDWKVTNTGNSRPGTIELVGKGPLTPSDISDLGNLGKLIGGTGSLVGGVFGLISGVSSLHAGDKLNAGFSLTSGAFGSAAAIASIIEGGAGLFGLVDAAAIAGSLAGVLGWVTAGLGLVTALVFPIIEVVKRDKQQAQFFGELMPTLDKYGFNGGPITEQDRKDEYPEYTNTGFA